MQVVLQRNCCCRTAAQAPGSTFSHVCYWITRHREVQGNDRVASQLLTTSHMPVWHEFSFADCSLHIPHPYTSHSCMWNLKAFSSGKPSKEFQCLGNAARQQTSRATLIDLCQYCIQPNKRSSSFFATFMQNRRTAACPVLCREGRPKTSLTRKASEARHHVHSKRPLCIVLAS